MDQNENIENENALKPNDKIAELNAEETEQVVGGAARIAERAVVGLEHRRIDIAKR